MKKAEGLMRGINLGGWLSQCREYSESHYSGFITEDDIRTIASWKFDHVRLPVDHNVIEDDNGIPSEAGYAHIHDCEKWCRKHGLNMIIDLHRTKGFSFDAAAAENTLFTSEELQERFLNVWKNIAMRFGKSDIVTFELLNEISDQDSSLWSSLAARCIGTIRKYSADSRMIIGGTFWNSVHTLKLLQIPTDDRIIYNFHFYEPFLFTHQCASWLPVIPDLPMSYPGDINEFRRRSAEIKCFGSGLADAEEMGADFMEKLIYEAVEAAENAGVPLYCGEYGVIDRADINDTAVWYEDIRSIFDKYGIGHAAWTYKEMDFGIIGEHYAPCAERIIRAI